MKNKLKVILPLMIILLFTSWSEMSKNVEEKLNDLTNKANSLDTLLNKEIDKVMTLDSIINLESVKVKVLDSLIDKSSSKIDSIAKEKIKSLQLNR